MSSSASVEITAPSTAALARLPAPFSLAEIKEASDNHDFKDRQAELQEVGRRLAELRGVQQADILVTVLAGLLSAVLAETKPCKVATRLLGEIVEIGKSILEVDGHDQYVFPEEAQQFVMALALAELGRVGLKHAGVRSILADASDRLPVGVARLLAAFASTGQFKPQLEELRALGLRSATHILAGLGPAARDQIFRWARAIQPTASEEANAALPGLLLLALGPDPESVARDYPSLVDATLRWARRARTSELEGLNVRSQDGICSRATIGRHNRRFSIEVAQFEAAKVGDQFSGALQDRLTADIEASLSALDPRKGTVECEAATMEHLGAAAVRLCRADVEDGFRLKMLRDILDAVSRWAAFRSDSASSSLSNRVVQVVAARDDRSSSAKKSSRAKAAIRVWWDEERADWPETQDVLVERVVSALIDESADEGSAFSAQDADWQCRVRSQIETWVSLHPDYLGTAAPDCDALFVGFLEALSRAVEPTSLVGLGHRGLAAISCAGTLLRPRSASFAERHSDPFRRLTEAVQVASTAVRPSTSGRTSVRSSVEGRSAATVQAGRSSPAPSIHREASVPVSETVPARQEAIEAELEMPAALRRRLLKMGPEAFVRQNRNLPNIEPMVRGAQRHWTAKAETRRRRAETSCVPWAGRKARSSAQKAQTAAAALAGFGRQPPD